MANSGSRIEQEKLNFYSELRLGADGCNKCKCSPGRGAVQVTQFVHPALFPTFIIIPI